MIWPITPLCAVLNNWLELRSDAVKLCLGHRRPVPQRADSIGPWLNNIVLLSWLGTLTTSTLVTLFQGGDLNLKCTKEVLISLLFTVLLAEHGYWVVDRALAALSRRVSTVGEINVRKEEYLVRRRYLQNLGAKSDVQRVSADPVDRAPVEDVIGFWDNKGIDGTVAVAREMLSQSWRRTKVE